MMCEHERGETGIESKRCVVGNARNAAAYRTRRGVVATGRAGRVRTRGRRPRRGRVGSRLVAPAGCPDRVARAARTLSCYESTYHIWK